MLYTKEQIGATTKIKTRKADMATDVYQRASSMNIMFNEEDMQGIRARNTASTGGGTSPGTVRPYASILLIYE